MKRIIYILSLLLLLSFQLDAQLLQLRTPIKGDRWPAYSIQRISWTSDNIDNIRIEASVDSGRTWQVIIGSYPASAQLYDWEVPNSPSDSCFIRITDVQNATVSSSNFKNNPFIIPPAFLTVDSLVTRVQSGSVIPITWNSGGIRNLRILLSTDNRTTYAIVADSVPATRSYYNLPVFAAGSNYHIRLEAIQQIPILANAPENFTVTPAITGSSTKFKGGSYDGASSKTNLTPSIQLITPKNNDSLFEGSILRVQWRYQQIIEKVHLFYSLDNGSTWQPVDSNITATAGYYDWKLPNSPSNQVRVKIEDASEPNTQHIQTGSFTILKKQIEFMSPNVATNVYVGTATNLVWRSGGIEQVRLLLLGNGRDSLLANQLNASMEVFNLAITPGLPDSFYIVIVDQNDSTVRDTSALIKKSVLPTASGTKYKGGSFDGHSSRTNIKGSLLVSSPTPGDTLIVVTNYTISWRASNVERLNIYFSPNNGSSWLKIDSNVAATAETYSWKTPNTRSNQCLIKIMDSYDTSVSSVLSASFVLAPQSIRNTTDSSYWIKGSPKLIEWIAKGIDTVSIAYKTSTHTNWLTISPAIPGSHEAYNWVLPQSINDSLFLKITDISDTAIRSERMFTGPFKSLVQQHAVHKYRGGSFDGHTQRSNISKIIVQRPAENEVIQSGTVYTIQWSTVNLEDSIQIQFSIDSGRTWVNIVKTLASNGRYEWSIPNNLSVEGLPETVFIKNDGIGNPIYAPNSTNFTKCLIRAIDPSGNEVVGISSKPFTIRRGEAPLRPTIKFESITDKQFIPDLIIRMNASSSAGSKITYTLSGQTASIQGDSLIIKQPGRINISAYAVSTSDSTNRSDTIQHAFCINPPRPVLELKDTVRLCVNDSIRIVSNSLFTHQWYRNGNPLAGATSGIFIATTNGVYTDSTHINGCSAGSLPLTVIEQTRPDTPIIIQQNNNLISSDANQYQWYLNNQRIPGATNKTQPILVKGMYKVETGTGFCKVLSAPFLVQTDPASSSQDDFTLTVYPNPAGSQFYLLLQFDKRISSYADINISDISGQPIWRGKRFIFNERTVRIPIQAKLAKGGNTVQVIINGYKVKAIQLIGL